MKLYDLLKDRINNPQGVISDSEICVINRRDFLYSETSVTQNFLRMILADRVSYEMYSLLDFLHASVCRIPDDAKVTVYQLSRSMTIPSLFLYSMLSRKVCEYKHYAPRGVDGVKCIDEFSAALVRTFYTEYEKSFSMESIKNDDKGVTMVLCNASDEAEVTSALKAFQLVRHGLIIIKGYGRLSAPNCGEIIVENNLNVHCTLAGFGYAAAI
jgi:hypothetical protein